MRYLSSFAYDVRWDIFIAADLAHSGAGYDDLLDVASVAYADSRLGRQLTS